MKRTLLIGLLLLTAPLSALAQMPGVARTQGEAPGAVPLAQLSPPGASHSDEPAAARSMAFGAGGNECRETVPGGPLLVIAYAVVLLVLGGYVALLALKNARLEASLTELEDQTRKPQSLPPSA